MIIVYILRIIQSWFMLNIVLSGHMEVVPYVLADQAHVLVWRMEVNIFFPTLILPTNKFLPNMSGFKW